MPYITHTDQAFNELHQLFTRVDQQLEQDDPAGIAGFIVSAFHEFNLDGLHRPDPDLVLTDLPQIPDPVRALSAAVKARLEHAESLDESLRLTRARGFLLEAVDHL